MVKSIKSKGLNESPIKQSLYEELREKYIKIYKKEHVITKGIGSIKDTPMSNIDIVYQSKIKDLVSPLTDLINRDMKNQTVIDINTENYKHVIKDCSEKIKSYTRTYLEMQQSQSNPNKSDFDTCFGKLFEKFKIPDSDFYNKVISEGLPLGIENEIPSSNGIWPLSQKQNEIFEQLLNIKSKSVSYKKHFNFVYNELSKELQMGWLSKVKKKKVSKALVKIHVIEKMKLNKLKLRIILDFKRNKVNSNSILRETINLPNPLDIIHMILYLMHFKSINKDDLLENSLAYWFLELDVESAYRHLSISKNERKYLHFYVDRLGRLEHNRLPFGLKVAPYLYCRFTSVIFRFILSLIGNKEADGLVYIDDLTFVLKNIKQTPLSISLILCMGYSSGLSWAFEKCKLRKSICNAIGYEFKTIGDGVSVKYKSENITDCKNLIEEILKDKKISLKTLQRVIGKFIAATTFNPQLRTNLTKLYEIQNLLESKNLKNLKLKVDGSILPSLQILNNLLISQVKEEIQINSIETSPIILCDASSNGNCSTIVLVDNQIYYSNITVQMVNSIFPPLCNKEKFSNNICVYELIAIIIGVDICRKYKTKYVFTDNKICSSIIKSRKSYTSRLQSLLQTIFNDVIMPTWISTDQNVEADKMSRNKNINKIIKAASKSYDANSILQKLKPSILKSWSLLENTV